MTNRRSLQTNMQRISRAQQFVPGHVGGRVASAQPVRERRKVGAMAQPIGDPPTTIYTGILDNGGVQTITASAFPANMTHALILVGAVNCDGFTAPTGWTELAGGGPHGAGDVSGGIIAQWSLLHTTDLTATRSFAFPTYHPLSGSSQSMALVSAYFTGGTGGSWSVTQGTHTTNTSSAYATGVGTASAWAQMCLLTGVYTWGDKGGFTAGQGPTTSACYPTSAGALSMAGQTPRPDGTLIDWNGIGAYGKPNSLTFAVTWA